MGLLLSQEVLELAAELEAPMDNEMVFSVFMLNAIFVVVVSLVQQEKETLSFNWFFAKGLIRKSKLHKIVLKNRSLVYIHISLLHF